MPSNSRCLWSRMYLYQHNLNPIVSKQNSLDAIFELIQGWVSAPNFCIAKVKYLIAIESGWDPIVFVFLREEHNNKPSVLCRENFADQTTIEQQKFIFDFLLVVLYQGRSLAWPNQHDTIAAGQLIFHVLIFGYHLFDTFYIYNGS